MLTERFQEALLYAFQLHANQKRKQSEVPYIAHLLGVTSLVLEDGGDEDQAIAALLHDAVEDQGGFPTLERIRTKFGNRVAEIVFELSDSATSPKPPWRERKESYLASLETADAGVIRVSLADKVYNARSILKDVRQDGDPAWQRFNGGKGGTLWYYRELIQEFKKHGDNFLLQELTRLVDEIELIADGKIGSQ
jgi:(p)ppGpp synthase/HD superfamily hydrolase